jgi:hypothetical protein
MERNLQSRKSINTKMKKNNILDLFPTLEKMKEHLHINLDTQEITDIRTGKILSQSLKINKESRNGYKTIRFIKNGKKYSLRVNRLFFYWHNGYLPDIVDHTDRNSLNNNIENLRELTNSQNLRNSEKRRKGSSIYKGVSWSKKAKKWVAYFFINNKLNHLGVFENEDDAGQIVNDQIRKYGLEEVSVMNDTPQERARRSSLFNEPEPILNLK